MCLVIHKPAANHIPDALLASAAEFNPRGFGIMSFDSAAGLTVQRRARTTLAEVRRLYRGHRDRECVLHLRYRTRGAVDLSNTQPLRVTREIFVVHNGTLPLSAQASDRSDTWHFVRDYVRPILRNRPELLYDAAFQTLLKGWAGPHNRLVFMDAVRRATVIINQEAGHRIDDLWVSNTRWFDGSLFNWHREHHAPSPRPQNIEFFA